MLRKAYLDHLSLTLYVHLWISALQFPTTAAASEQELVLGPGFDPGPDPGPLQQSI